MPAVPEPRHSYHPPVYTNTTPHRSERVHQNGRVERRHQRRSAASVRVSRHQPRARVDQHPRDEHPRPRRSTGHDLARRSSYTARRIRPEITILSVAPMSEHPAFSDGHKGAYIPPEAPPSYEQAMRTSHLLNEPLSETPSTNRICQINRVFPERHIVNSDAVTIPSYSESISQQLHPTVTFITSSSEVTLSTNHRTFAPLRTRGIGTSQNGPLLITRSDIAARRDVRPTATHQDINRDGRRRRSDATSSFSSPKPPKPPRPVLPPKPKERKSMNRNCNNNSDIEADGQDSENRQSSIVTQTMSSTANQDILSLFDSPNVGASPQPLQAPLLPNSSAPSSASATTNRGQPTRFSNLDGLFTNVPPPIAAKAATSTQGPASNFSNLDGLFSSMDQKTNNDFPCMSGNGTTSHGLKLNGPTHENPFMISQIQPVVDNSDVLSPPAMNLADSNWGLAGSSSLLTPASTTGMLQLKPQPLSRTNNDAMLTSPSMNKLIGSSQSYQPMASDVPNSNAIGGSSSHNMLFIPQGGVMEQKQSIMSPANSRANELQLGSLTQTARAQQNHASPFLGQHVATLQPVSSTTGSSVAVKPVKPELPFRGPPPLNHQIAPASQTGANDSPLSGNTEPQPSTSSVAPNFSAKPPKPVLPVNQPMAATPQTGANENFVLWGNTVAEAPVLGTVAPDTSNPTKPGLHSKGPPVANGYPVVIPRSRVRASPVVSPILGSLHPQLGMTQSSVDSAVLVPMQQPTRVSEVGQPPRNVQQSRKLPPPPRPSSGPKRAVSIRPTTAPPPRPTAKPTRPPASEASLIEGLSTKLPPPTKPEVFSSPSLFGQSSNSNLVQSPSNAGTGASLLDDPLPATNSASQGNNLLLLSGMGASNRPGPLTKPMSLGGAGLSIPPDRADSEPLYASVRKKSKSLTQPVNETVVAPPSGIDSLMDLMEPNKPDIHSDESGNPPPLPATRPPLEDFEDLLSPAEMNAAMAERNKMTCNDSENIFGLVTPKQAEPEDPYELVVEGLPHVKQSSAPPVLSGKNRSSGKSKTASGPSKQNDSLLFDPSGSKDGESAERRKSDDSEKSFGQKLRKRSLKFRMKFTSPKTEANSSKSPVGEFPPRPTADKDLSQLAPTKPARPPPRPDKLPKKATSVVVTPVAEPAPGPPSAKAKPVKPPPPRIYPTRSAPARPPPNTNQNNRAAVHTPAPTPKPRSNSKPGPPLKPSPDPKVRAVPASRSAQKITPARSPPMKPPTKRYGNLRPPPAPKPSVTDPEPSAHLEIEDGEPFLQRSKAEVPGSKVTMTAMFDFNGIADDELTFKAGDTICDVTEVNPDWYRGLLGGKHGIFPKPFVTAHDDALPSTGNPPLSADFPDETPAGGPHPHEVEDSRAAPSFPDVDEISDTPPSEQHIEAADAEATKEGNSRTGVALFPFQGQDEAELKFLEGDVIEITGEVNDDWLMGKVDDKEGMFPAAYVQIGHPVVAEHQGGMNPPEDVNIVTKQPPAVTTIPTTPSVSGFVEPMATGIQDYTATSSEEISFQVGDVLYLLERIDETWLTAQHDGTSAVGNVPLSHINVIHPLP